MITPLLWFFGVMSLMGLAITWMFSQRLQRARDDQNNYQPDTYTPMDEAQDTSSGRSEVDTLKGRVRLYLLLSSFDVLVFFGLLVAKIMGIE